MTCAVTTLKILPLTNMHTSTITVIHVSTPTSDCGMDFRVTMGSSPRRSSPLHEDHQIPLTQLPSRPPGHFYLQEALELFWFKLDEESFQSSDWKVRFHSGEVCVAGPSSAMFCQVLPLTAVLSNIMPLLRLMLLSTNFNIDTHSSTMYNI